MITIIMDQLVHQALIMIDTDSNDDENEKNDENDENRRESILSSEDQDEKRLWLKKKMIRIQISNTDPLMEAIMNKVSKAFAASEIIGSGNQF